jgi:small subunit ribosomal protein S20
MACPAFCALTRPIIPAIRAARIWQTIRVSACSFAPTLDDDEASDEVFPRAVAARNKFVREASMANTTSAKKATRKMARRTLINKSRRSRVRTFVRKVEEAIASGDLQAAAAAFKAAQPELMRAATKGVMHKNTASRKVSRLAARVKAISA